MEKKNSKGGTLIGLLLGIIIVLVILVILFATGKINLKFNKDKTNEENNNVVTNYKEYYKGEIISLKDRSKWLVLEDSNKNSEIVKLMNIDDFVLSGASCDEQKEFIYCDETHNYDKLFTEYFNSDTKYKGSEIESLINSYANLIPAKLKEVDGYKIRLLSIDDIFQFDNSWIKENGNKYIYTGDKALTMVFLGAWTLDTVESRCTGNCGNFFVVRNDTGGLSLGMGASGLAEIKPVIYAYKSSL